MKKNAIVDSVGGAKILSERFGSERQARPLAAVETADALPIFHWTGVEPEPRVAEPVAEAAPVRRRPRLLRAGRGRRAA